MKKTTQELLSLIQSTESIEHYLSENKVDMQDVTLDKYLSQLMEEKGLKVADVMNRSQQSDYVYKVFKNQRKASRDILLAIALGMQCDLNETQTLLRIATTARLDPRNKRDAVLIYAVMHQFTVIEVNEILYDLEVSEL